METTERMIKAIQERKRIETERIDNLRKSVKEIRENRRTQTEQQTHPD